MSMFSALVRMAGRNLQKRSRGGSRNCGVGVLAVMTGGMAIPGIGAVSVFAQECDPVEVAQLLASDGATGDVFGGSVSISGDTAVVGAKWDGDNGYRAGSVYIFVQSGGTWTQQAKLMPDDGEAQDEFGVSVSISGDTAVIGMYADNDNGSNSGSVYVFVRSGDIWIQQAKLTPSDGAMNDWFGNAVSISGDIAVIGSFSDDDNGPNSGSAYVFTRSEGVWTEQAKLLPTDGGEFEYFGKSVALHGHSVVIGATGANDNGSNSGSAYVFTYNEDVWTQQAKLLPADGMAHDSFGVACSLFDETAVVGAFWANDNGSSSGSAYVFARSGGVWAEEAKLLPSDGMAGDEFGTTVVTNGNTIVIGAPKDFHNGYDTGSAYVFTRDGNMWSEQAKLLPESWTEGSWFGSSVAISNDKVVIGEVGSTWPNSVRVFDLNCAACPQDLNNDGVVNTQDFLAFLSAWSAGDPLADWNSDGVVNTLDFLAYLTDWTAGCS